MRAAMRSERAQATLWTSEAVSLYLDPLTRCVQLLRKGALRIVAARTSLSRRNEVILGLLVELSESRYPFRHDHSINVQKYAVAIAEAMKLPREMVDVVKTAAVLHDVATVYGKYADALTQIDKLSLHQWRTIQEHPTEGARLAASLVVSAAVIDAIRFHHENWDGTGYPDGRARQEIPLPARIIRFADTMDAMLSDRPYRSALSPAELRSELIRCRASQFDPSLVDVLLEPQVWESVLARVVRDDSLHRGATWGEASDSDAADQKTVVRPASLRLLA